MYFWKYVRVYYDEIRAVKLRETRWVEPVRNPRHFTDGSRRSRELCWLHLTAASPSSDDHRWTGGGHQENLVNSWLLCFSSEVFRDGRDRPPFVSRRRVCVSFVIVVRVVCSSAVVCAVCPSTAVCAVCSSTAVCVVCSSTAMCAFFLVGAERYALPLGRPCFFPLTFRPPLTRPPGHVPSPPPSRRSTTAVTRRAAPCRVSTPLRIHLFLLPIHLRIVTRRVRDRVAETRAMPAVGVAACRARPAIFDHSKSVDFTVADPASSRRAA